MTVLSVRLRSVERPRLEDKEGVINDHTNTPSRLKLEPASEAEDGDMEDEDADM